LVLTKPLRTVTSPSFSQLTTHQTQLFVLLN
jgi:hypothetical protein